MTALFQFTQDSRCYFFFILKQNIFLLPDYKLLFQYLLRCYLPYYLHHLFKGGMYTNMIRRLLQYFDYY